LKQAFLWYFPLLQSVPLLFIRDQIFLLLFSFSEPWEDLPKVL
jgi:hypothetical protein